MIKYSLVSNSYNGIVLIQKKALSELDQFTYNNFSSIEQLISYFNLIASDKPVIKYTYRNVSKYLELILKTNNNYILSTIMKNTSFSNIDIRTDNYIVFLNHFLNSVDIYELNFLLGNNYITQKIYFDVINYKNNPNDRGEFYNGFKREFSNYLKFRRLYIGRSKYLLRISSKNNKTDSEIKKAATDDELFNDLYNNGGLDEVYSIYDFDDLSLIEGIDMVDGFCKKL